MSKIKIQISGVAAELVLGNYMPKDATIFNDWMEFYHFNDLIHETQLLSKYVSEIVISEDEVEIFKGKIPDTKFQQQKSFSPVMVHQTLYLRTECAERSVFQCEFEIENFDKNKLFFRTQDYDLLFKVGKSFITGVIYDTLPFELEWVSAHPIGDICLLCRYENGYLVPIYDAVKKLAVK
ncbi:MAG: hypothetical protein PHT07_19620 [Paludibacter sp.]|nr:hypothetical protein [Paludibacter sp.]